MLNASMLRIRLAIVLLCATASAAIATAQTPPASPSPSPAPPPPASPSNVPPPLPDVGAEPDFEPQVTIIRTETETREETRVNGELRYIKVTPRGGGVPYFLVPSGNGQTFIRRNTLDFGLSVPMWQLFSW